MSIPQESADVSGQHQPAGPLPIRRHGARSVWIALGALGGVALLLAAVVLWLNLRGETALTETAPTPSAPAGTAAHAEQLQRGALLARAGNCAACHTARGGAELAGGRAIATPFGTVFAANLTPDPETGLGRWSAAHFWRALHHGRSKDGRLLAPACPYPSFTQVTRADADDLFAYLQSRPAVSQPQRPHALRWPYGTQPALAVWRAAFFRPGSFEPRADKPAEWNRGAYLVRGLGHCAACHAERNAWGASRDPLALAGGLMPVQHWLAPSLASPREAGVAGWPLDDVVALLKTGVVRSAAVPHASMLGPMADVVFNSTQHLPDADLRAIAVYLQDLPPPTARPDPEPPARPDPEVFDAGARLYEQHCASCHGRQGEGAVGAYPPLAGHRAVTMASPANLVRVVVEGGFPPGTAGHPRPYGMPPFGPLLTDAEIAALLSYLRSAWGHAAEPVSALDVLQLR